MRKSKNVIQRKDNVKSACGGSAAAAAAQGDAMASFIGRLGG